MSLPAGRPGSPGRESRVKRGVRAPRHSVTKQVPRPVSCKAPCHPDSGALRSPASGRVTSTAQLCCRPLPLSSRGQNVAGEGFPPPQREGRGGTQGTPSAAWHLPPRGLSEFPEWFQAATQSPAPTQGGQHPSSASSPKRWALATPPPAPTGLAGACPRDTRSRCQHSPGPGCGPWEGVAVPAPGSPALGTQPSCGSSLGFVSEASWARGDTRAAGWAPGAHAQPPRCSRQTQACFPHCRREGRSPEAFRAMFVALCGNELKGH